MSAVGIDVSKGKSTVTIRGLGDVVILPPCDILHTQSVINDMSRQIKELDWETKSAWNTLKGTMNRSPHGFLIQVFLSAP